MKVSQNVRIYLLKAFFVYCLYTKNPRQRTKFKPTISIFSKPLTNIMQTVHKLHCHLWNIKWTRKTIVKTYKIFHMNTSWGDTHSCDNGNMYRWFPCVSLSCSNKSFARTCVSFVCDYSRIMQYLHLSLSLNWTRICLNILVDD